MPNLINQSKVTLLPPENRKLTVLDRSKFNLEINVCCLIADTKQVGKIRALLNRDCLLRLAHVRCIVPHDEADKKRVLLSETIENVSLEQVARDEEAMTALADFAIDFGRHKIVLDYSYWSMEKILDSVLEKDIPRIGSFEAIGHIAHLNLRPEQLPYKNLIGQVLLDKNGQIKTVVNKLDSIDHVFRFFEMEVIAGARDLITTQSENNCRFTMDYSKVYWNSRLQFEHDRLVSTFAAGDVVCDVFAGIGPFSIPAAKNKQCTVLANDLNPESFRWLCHNAKANGVESLITAHNMDGRDFIKQSLSLLQKVQRERKKRKLTSSDAVQHYIMNLPASAETFVDAFKGIFSGSAPCSMPFVHVYCFSKNPPDTVTHEKHAQSLVEEVLGHSIDGPELAIHIVRNVAPGKRMVCVSFKLPEAVAVGNPIP